jgi:hypothetical protein
VSSWDPHLALQGYANDHSTQALPLDRRKDRRPYGGREHSRRRPRMNLRTLPAARRSSGKPRRRPAPPTSAAGSRARAPPPTRSRSPTTPVSATRTAWRAITSRRIANTSGATPNRPQNLPSSKTVQESAPPPNSHAHRRLAQRNPPNDQGPHPRMVRSDTAVGVDHRQYAARPIDTRSLPALFSCGGRLAATRPLSSTAARHTPE